jgi:ATP-binding cassette subfamily C protein
MPRIAAADATWLTLRRCLAEVWGLLRGRLVLATALIVLITLTEGVGLLTLVPLLAVAGFGDAGAGGVGGLITSAFAAAGLEPELKPLLLLFVLVSIGRAVLQRWQTVNLASLTEAFLHHLRMRLYRAFVHARYEYITRVRLSDFLHALTDETHRAGAIMNQVIQMTAQLLITGVFVVIALRVSWQATMVAMACGGLMSLALWRLTRRSEVVGQTLTQAGAQLVAVASEHMAGIKTTRSYRAEAAHERAFSTFSGNVSAAAVGASRNYSEVSMHTQMASSVLAAAIIYIAMAWLNLPAGALLLLIVIFSRLVPRVSSFQFGIQSLLHALPAYARVQRLSADAEAQAEAVMHTTDDGALGGDISFESVSFSYTRGNGDGIHDLHLRIPYGRTTAIIGPSGAGKSTVADLLTGLLTPATGRIVLGGTVLDAGSMGWWRTRIGYVAQDTFLFHDTIRANLSWVRPDATEGDLWQALGQARAADFVRRLPQGLETRVGDRGVQLSGGERQRLALARALLRRPDLLILDEATSALDADNERAIYEALALLHGTLTVVLITHRLAAVHHVDLLYRMERGHVVAVGAPEDVLAL